MRATALSLALLPLAACDPEEDAARALPDFPDEPTSATLIWNGFTHSWGYNHRLNSLGDYVGPVTCGGSGCAGEVVHTAASGSGSDEAAWESRHTAVTAPDVAFRQGAALLSFDIEDGEGLRHERTAEARVPATGRLADPERLAAVLNGFDVYATRDADKLRALEIAVGDPRIEGDEVVFDVTVAVELDCDSLECDGTSKLDTDVHYRVMVAWLVAGGEGLAVTPVAEGNAYAWEGAGDAEEIALADMVQASGAGGVGGFAYGSAAVAFRRLAVTLDRDHHMAEWASTVEPGAYDPTTGWLDYDVALLFKQWNAGTVEAPLSYTAPGEATFEADLALLQFSRGCATPGTADGVIAWDADGGPATDAAVQTEPVGFPGATACAGAVPEVPGGVAGA